MSRKIVFEPAWDRTHTDPKKNFGVSDLVIYFLVEGSEGIVEFHLSTNWFLPHVMDRRRDAMKRDVLLQTKDFLLDAWITPKPLDVCYYSLRRICEDDIHFDAGTGTKRIFDGASVYYGYKYAEESDGRYSPDHVYQKLITDGEDAVWDYLERYYTEVFGE